MFLEDKKHTIKQTAGLAGGSYRAVRLSFTEERPASGVHQGSNNTYIKLLNYYHIIRIVSASRRP